jgi:hypothetical protein
MFLERGWASPFGHWSANGHFRTHPSLTDQCLTDQCRLLAKGKSKMSIVGAAMHKLLRQVFGVLKSQKPFDPNFLLTLTK